LNSNKIKYAVLRNYKTLPEKIVGSDIDIIVNCINIEIFLNDITKNLNYVNYRLWKSYNKNYSIRHMIYVPEHLINVDDIVRIDFFDKKLIWMGLSFLSNDILWNNVTKNNAICHLNESLSNAISILNGLAYSGQIKPKYYDDYRNLNKINKSSVIKYIAIALNESEEVIRGQLQLEVLENIRPRLFHSNSNKINKVTKGCIIYWKTLINRICSPPGTFVTFIGPDGVGKTTLALMLRDEFKMIYPNVIYFHLYPKLFIFKYLDRISHWRWRLKKKENTPEWEMRSKKFGYIASLIRLIYLYMRFIYGYIFIYFNLLKGSLVICDRWCYDLIIDPGSKGLRLPDIILKTILSAIPKPDKVIGLINTPSEIVKRKDELNILTVTAQLELVKSIIRKNKNSVLVDTSKSTNDSLTKIAEFITK